MICRNMFRVATGLGLLVCSAAVFGETPAAATYSKSEMMRQQVELQMVSAMDPNRTNQSSALRNVVNQLESLQLSDDVSPIMQKKIEEKKTGASAKPEASASPSVPVEVPTIKNLDNVENPVDVLAVANALYQAKDYKRAERFYRMAIPLKTKDVPARQWAMYQVANCVRSYDLDQAISDYERLNAEYPSNSWASAAMAQRNNLNWLKENQAVLSRHLNNDPNQK